MRGGRIDSEEKFNELKRKGIMKGPMTWAEYQEGGKKVDEWRSAEHQKQINESVAEQDKELKKINDAYDTFYKEHPELKEVVCNLNENLELVKERNVPRAECERRHALKIALNQAPKTDFDKFANFMLKATVKLGDTITKIPGVSPAWLGKAWDLVSSVPEVNEYRGSGFHGYKLRKVPKQDFYWIIDPYGKKVLKTALPKDICVEALGFCCAKCK